MDVRFLFTGKRTSVARLALIFGPLVIGLAIVGSASFSSTFVDRGRAAAIDPRGLQFSTHLHSKDAANAKNRQQPKVMLGIMMMDTPAAVLQRRILRLMFPPEDVSLHFPICRPTAETMREPGVVAIDMEENMNLGKTQRWFWYAQRHRPKSVKAVFKMDTDTVFCLSRLLDTVSDSRGPFEYFGQFMNHYSCWEHKHCPPKQCKDNNTFIENCWYYMGGGLYGVSTPLLDRLVKVSIFTTPQTQDYHEDITVAHWINQSDVRTSVIERRFIFQHDKDVVNVSPSTYSNYVIAYMKALMDQRCMQEVSRIAEHFANMYRPEN
jgi:hypothetical protein